MIARITTGVVPMTADFHNRGETVINKNLVVRVRINPNTNWGLV